MHQKCVTEIPLKPWPALLNHIQRGCVIYMFEVKKNSKQPLTEQIYNQISDSIESNLLVAGTKLPSVRALSNKLGVSTYTISSVYESLVAQNKIEAKKGCGYFILPNRSCTSSHDNYPKDPLVEIDLYSHQISSGYLPPEWLKAAVPSTVTGRIIRSALTISKPASPQGSPNLLELIAIHLHHYQIYSSSSHIILTNGATHAISLILSMLIKDEGTIIVEQPSYHLFRMLTKTNKGINVQIITRDIDGPNLQELEQVAGTHQPKVLLTQTLLHNPTGGNTSPANCCRILALAKKYNFYIIEDDILGGVASPNTVRLANLDGFERVFYVNGFSKVLSPALRLGYIVSPKCFVEPLLNEKISSVLSCSHIEETIVTYVLESGRFNRHLEQLRLRIMKERAKAKDWLMNAGLRISDKNFYGLFLWVELPNRIDMEKLIIDAKENDFFLLSGDIFSNSGIKNNYLRLNVTHCNSFEFKSYLFKYLAR